MIIQDLISDYSISGRNQDENPEVTYKGILSLSLDENNRIIAKWFINNTDEQKGYGFFKDNILVLNFSYTVEKPVKLTTTFQCKLTTSSGAN